MFFSSIVSNIWDDGPANQTIYGLILQCGSPKQLDGWRTELGELYGSPWFVYIYTCKTIYIQIYRGFHKWGYPKWMVYSGKSYKNG